MVTVKWIPTEANPADLFTKVLGRQPFERHRRAVLNQAAADTIESMRAARAKHDSPPTAEVAAFSAGRLERAVRIGAP